MPPQYLIVQIPGRGQVTLSLPGGIERAFRFGRLPQDAEVWHSAAGVWLPILLHPAIVKLREAALSDAYDYDFEFTPNAPPLRQDPVPVEPPRPEPAPVPLALEPAPVAAALDPAPVAAVPALDPVASAPEPAADGEDAGLLPLIPVGDWESHRAELSRFIARSTAQEERRRSSRLSVGIRRESGPVFFAGVAEAVEDHEEVPPITLARFRARLLAGALLLLVAMGIGGWLWYRLPAVTLAADSTDGRILSLRERDSLAQASSGANVHFGAPNPLADLEADLESDLGIADAVIWHPAIDFGSEDQLMRSARKLDAVRNSIGLYRLGAWRTVDLRERERDPRLEPFAEAERIDAVLGIMNAAVVFLDSLTGHFRVNGDALVFDRAEDAAHYLTISRFADSLLQAPVELDSFPSIRAPRRVVARLLATLPTGFAAPPTQP